MEIENVYTVGVTRRRRDEMGKVQRHYVDCLANKESERRRKMTTRVGDDHLSVPSLPQRSGPLHNSAVNAAD
ncbi:hypothetical protein QQF64_010388 [Cirrhinus molitorella]|uniref:Uncharacterized protein n=1 Tax=Cirrhinus molitorella TaxID=172907 RepID=A0ABR3M6I6_9TELE